MDNLKNGIFKQVDETIQKKDLIETVIEMRQKLTGSYFKINELMQLYLHTKVSGYFIKDNASKCDTGSVQKCLKKTK